MFLYLTSVTALPICSLAAVRLGKPRGKPVMIYVLLETSAPFKEFAIQRAVLAGLLTAFHIPYSVKIPL